MKKSAILLLCAFLWLMPALAVAWETTFSEESLPEELLERSSVIAAGGPGAQEAGQILREIMRASGAQHVLENPVFETVDGLSDEEVVHRLSHLRVDIVVILRLFEEDDSGQMGLVSFYNIDGSAIAGFVVNRGVPLTREQRRNVGRGISQQTVDSITDTLSQAPPAESQEEIEARRQRLREHTAQERERNRRHSERRQREASRQPEQNEASFDEPQPELPPLVLRGQGASLVLIDTRTRERFSGADLYRRLEQTELAVAFLSRERRGQRLHSGSRVGTTLGIALGVVGAGWLAVLPYASMEEEPRVQQCADFTNSRVEQNCRILERRTLQQSQRYTALALLSSGAAVTLGALLTRWRLAGFDPHPLSLQALQELVDGFSDESPEATTEPGSRARPVQISLVPFFEAEFVGDVQAGLRLSLSW